MIELEKYSEMMVSKYKNAILTPLLGTWEFIKKPSLHWEQDLNEITKLSHRLKWKHNFDFKRILNDCSSAIVITDVFQKIQYTSVEFSKMTGYSKSEVVGKNPNFLQGIGTDKIVNETIKQAIKAKERVSANVLNYKKDGSPYYCQLHIEPLYNSSNQHVNFIAIEKSID